MAAGSVARGDQPFTEKSFYLSEFRGRTVALAATSDACLEEAAVGGVLEELGRNGTRVLILAADPRCLERLCGAPPLAGDTGGLAGRVWRSFQQGGRVGVQVSTSQRYAAVHEVALRLGVMKLVWLDPGGGLLRSNGDRVSFMDQDDFGVGVVASCKELLEPIAVALRAGLPAINLCTPGGLGDELFTYTGSGTLFTQHGYVDVRRLTIDDLGAAHSLVARGVEEGYLFPRNPDEQDVVLAQASGAFVEGSHLAGIGALLRYRDAQGSVGEIASLYTLTRFLGEGVGGHLVRALCGQAKARGDHRVFACTTRDRVAGFFERNGFARTEPAALPDAKWEGYADERRQRLICLVRTP